MAAPAEAPRTGRAYATVCAAVAGFALGYALPVYTQLPRPFYDPLARRWYLAARMPPIPMGYLGQVLWGLGGALVAGLLAAAIAPRVRGSDRLFLLGAAWSLTAVLVVLAYFTWNNWP